MSTVSWAVLLVEPEGPPALSKAGGVSGGGRGQRYGPLAAAQATTTAPACGGDNSWERRGAAALDVAAARDAAAAAGVPRARACCGPEPDTVTAWSTQRIDAVGLMALAGKEGAGVAAEP